MYSRVFPAVLLLAFVLASQCRSQQILTNGSFESGMSGWTTGPFPVSVVTSYLGVTPADGSRFLALAGPASVGYTYARVISQSRPAPFGSGIPADNFVVYLTASVYLHTSAGRDVSYALALEPGYGQAGASFHGGPRDAWVTAQTWGYYLGQDPFDAASVVKPIVASLELRDPLQAGEFLLLDHVRLTFGGAGVPEPGSLAALIMGMVFLITKTRNRESTK